MKKGLALKFVSIHLTNVSLFIIKIFFLLKNIPVEIDFVHFENNLGETIGRFYPCQVQPINSFIMSE